MKNKELKIGFATLLLTLAFGCSSKTAKEEESDLPSSVDADLVLSGDSDSGKAGGLQTVNFALDSYSLDMPSKGRLKANAETLKSKTSMRIQIEGHCDERGGIQYNLALGEKRANAVRRYLMDMGISGDRVTTISFGKERPIATGSDEASWAQNRRANFVVTSR